MRFILALTLAFVFGLPALGTAAPAEPIIGTWAGGGTIQSKSGRREKVRCRISYSRASGKTYGFSAICASTAGRTKSGRGRLVRSKGNRYTGRLYDAEHAVSGRIVVTVRGKRQTMRVSSEKGSGRLTLVRR